MRVKIVSLLLVTAFGFGLSGCVSMSAQDRRERAYRHYVQKQIKKRQREVARAQKAANRDLKKRIKSLQPSDPKITTSVESLPESMPESMSEPVPASDSEPIAAPITVSASTTSPTDGGPEQP